MFKRFTCYVVNRVESDSKPPDFVRVVTFETPSCQLNSLPVLFSERRIVIDVESGTYATTHSDTEYFMSAESKSNNKGHLLFKYPTLVLVTLLLPISDVPWCCPSSCVQRLSVP